MKNNAADHKPLLTRVNRIEGQIKGIKKMINDGNYCIDILTQTKAIRSALKGLELKILEGHVEHCLLNAVKTGSEKEIQIKIEEIMDLIKKSNK
jgi:DNA-binding FrmR family transcriptional regulator